MAPWYTFERSLILASASPRRREILSLLGLGFTVVVPKAINEESYLDPNRIEKTLQLLADKKAALVSPKHPEALVLGADTVVCIDGIVLGKPVDRNDARTMVTRLSGRDHIVYTAVGLRCESLGYACQVIEKTVVRFRSIEADEIERYLDFNDFADKAGAYAIQGRALSFIDMINGCYYNVMGLPVSRTIKLITDCVCRKEKCDVCAC